MLLFIQDSSVSQVFPVIYEAVMIVSSLMCCQSPERDFPHVGQWSSDDEGSPNCQPVNPHDIHFFFLLLLICQSSRVVWFNKKKKKNQCGHSTDSNQKAIFYLFILPESDLKGGKKSWNLSKIETFFSVKSVRRVCQSIMRLALTLIIIIRRLRKTAMTSLSSLCCV